MRPTLSFADNHLLDRIIDEARHILATTGMEIRGPQLRQRLLDAGLPADANGRILFPPAIVEHALASAPERFTLFDRDGAPVADIGGDRVHFVPGSSGLKVLDHRTEQVRPALSADFMRMCVWAPGWSIFPTWPPRFPPTISKPKSPTPGASISA